MTLLAKLGRMIDEMPRVDRRGFLRVSQHMGVGPQRGGHTGVPEHLRDDLNRHTGTQHLGRERVT